MVQAGARLRACWRVCVRRLGWRCGGHHQRAVWGGALTQPCVPALPCPASLATLTAACIGPVPPLWPWAPPIRPSPPPHTCPRRPPTTATTHTRTGNDVLAENPGPPRTVLWGEEVGGARHLPFQGKAFEGLWAQSAGPNGGGRGGGKGDEGKNRGGDGACQQGQEGGARPAERKVRQQCPPPRRRRTPSLGAKMVKGSAVVLRPLSAAKDSKAVTARWSCSVNTASASYRRVVMYVGKARGGGGAAAGSTCRFVSGLGQ